MTTPLALFNGSYLSHKPTGIGVVARDLVAALDPALVPLLDPLGGDRPGSLPIPATLSPEHGRKGHLARLLWTQNQLPRLLKASGASLLLSPLPEAPVLRGVRSVVLAHDLLPLRHPQFTPLLAYHLAYVPLVLHRAVRVLCNSEATAREVHGRLGVPLRRLVPIRLGFDPGLLRPLGLERQPFFLVLGRHDDRYTPELRKLAEALGIGPRCDWVAWVSDQERLDLLNRCQALVVASLWEGFGLPALEGMACGAPVIAARAGALPEVVGEAALLVDPLREGEITAAMRRIQGEASLRRQLSRAGPVRARLFLWDETAHQVMTILRDCA